MNIKGKIVTLRAVELEDMELLRGMLNDPEMEKRLWVGHFQCQNIHSKNGMNRQ